MSRVWRPLISELRDKILIRELAVGSGGEKHKELKPQRKGGSTFGSALIFFESQEANPTWSDDTKVDVSVYLSSQMDEVVKGLLKKKP